MISQVAGRAGRREEPGRVLIQALEPNHSAIQAALTYDFDSFFDEELPNREDLHYPPFGFLALIRIESESESNALKASAAMAKALKPLSLPTQALSSDQHPRRLPDLNRFSGCKSWSKPPPERIYAKFWAG